MWRGVALGPRRLPSLVPRPPWPRFAPSERTLRAVTVALATAFVLATTFGVTGLVEQHGSTALGASTTLTVLTGEVTFSGDGATFATATDGEILRAGTTVRTSATAYAVITYFDGSTVSIDPNTTVTIVALGLDPDGSKTISMRQELGRTWHVVQRLLTGSSRYEVLTPVMTASVRGTMFAVAVTTDAQGDIVSTLETVEGTVAASVPGRQGEVLVPAGSRATATAGGAIGPVVPISDADRTVTVTIGASTGVVIDDVGRVNGVLEDRILAQTPGATIERRDGALLVRLPSVPDGRLVVVTRSDRARHGAVGLFTDLAEQRRSTLTTKQRIPADGSGLAVATVEIRRSQAPAVGTPASDDEKDALAARASAGGDKKDKDKTKKDDGGGPGPGGPGGFAPDAQLPNLPFGGPAERATAGAPARSTIRDEGTTGTTGNDRPADAGDGRSKDDQPAAAPAPEKATASEASRGFVPSAPLPEIPTLVAPGSKEPTTRSDPQPATDTRTGTDRTGTDRTATDTRGGSDRGGGKPDTKGKP